MDRPPTLAVDLDGVIFEHRSWPERGHFGKLTKGCIRALESLKNDGWDIVIHTARHPDDFDLVEDKLQEIGVPYDRFWRGIGKPLADIYLDDRGIKFEGDWRVILRAIKTFDTWSKDGFARPPEGHPDCERAKDR